MDIQNALTKVNLLASDPRVGLVGSLLSLGKGKSKAGEAAPKDRFSLSAFTAQLQADGFRISKGYYYQVYIILPEQNIVNQLMFNCKKVSLPGWRAKTQTGKIYGIPYEIAIEIEQDPVFLAFNIDILHSIEQYFMDARKQATFSPDSYSPEYKTKYQFNMVINVTDENFVPQFTYTLENSMIKTVQNVNYGSDAQEVSDITVEVVYEKVFVADVRNDRAKALPYVSKGNPNKLQIGPFSTDISMLNMTKNTITNVPDWFSGPTKL
jgi:hypothetical protein